MPFPQRPMSQGGVGLSSRPGGSSTAPPINFLSGVPLDTSGRTPMKGPKRKPAIISSLGSSNSLQSDVTGSGVRGAPRSGLGSAGGKGIGSSTGATRGSSMPPLFNAPAKRLNTAPAGASRPHPVPPPTTGINGGDSGSTSAPSLSNVRRTSASGTNIGSASGRRRTTSATSRPPSSGAMPPQPNHSAFTGNSSSSANVSGSGNGGGKNDFHKGLVSALHEVLRKQRHGVFPQPVTSQDVEAMRSVNGNTNNGSTAPSGGVHGSGYGSSLPQQHNNGNATLNHGGPGPAQPTYHQGPPPTAPTGMRPPPGQAHARPSTRDGTSSGGLGGSVFEQFGSSTTNGGSRVHSAGSEHSTPAGGGGADERIEALIRQRKQQWAQNRWKQTREEERKELEKRQTTGLGKGYRVDTPTMREYEENGADLFLDEDTIAQLHNLERMERQARQHLTVAETKRFTEVLRLHEHRFSTLLSNSFDMSMSSVGSGGGQPLSSADADRLKAEGNRLYEQGEYAAAIKQYTRAIEACPENPVLLTNRAAANMALLNYDSVVKDCLKAVSIDAHLVRGYGRLAHAYLLLGQYRNAHKHYTSAVHYAQLQGHGSLDSLRGEAAAVEHVEKAKQLQEADSHANVLTLLDRACPFIGDPPVAMMRLRSLTALDPVRARSDLTKLLGMLEHPAANAQAANGAVLFSNSVTHFCDVLVALAKASFYCGLHYFHIAQQYLQQCLQLRADNKPAQTLQRMISQFDHRFQEANQLLSKKQYQDAHSSFTMALAVDPHNKKLQGLTFTSRAEVSMKLANIPAVISDCTSALECDPQNVKALTRRAKCFADIGDFNRAIRDMERAVAVNADLTEELVALKQRQQEENNGFGGSTPRGAGPSAGSRPSSSSAYGPDFQQRQQYQQQQRPHTSQDAQRCHYHVLGVPRFSDLAAVRQQYRKLSLRYHPDKCANESSVERKRSEVRFKEIASAYSTLGDRQQKQLYDTNLRNGTVFS